MAFAQASSATALKLTMAGGAATSNILSMAVPIQIKSNWCWAATSLGVDDFYSSPTAFTQCSIAGDTLGRNDCCDNPTPNPCNIPYFLDDALKTVNHFVSLKGVQTMAIVRAEIDGGRPLGARVGWRGGGGHFMAIIGYDTVADTLVISDPIYGRSVVTVAVFVSAYQGSGAWTHTYFTK